MMDADAGKSDGPNTAAPLVLSVFPSFAVGGAQVRFAALANRFGRRYRHCVVALNGDDACRARLDPRLDAAFPQLGGRKGALVDNLRVYRRTLRALRPDVLVTHNWGAIEWAMANLPGLARHIHIEDGFGPEERTAQLPRRALTRRVVLARSTVVLPSRTLVRIALHTWRLPRRRVRYIPNGIALARFAGDADGGLTAPWPGDGPVVGTVAALRAEKNLARLLRAFALAARERPMRLAIVGDGVERAALEALARTLGIADRTAFTGHSDDPAAFYRAFDIFALSSDTEQMPLTVIEAMAAGLPVAATDVGDVADMLAAANRRFVVALDDTALAGAIGALAADAAARAAVGAANRDKAARDFDQETMFSAYAGLLDGRQDAPAAA